MKVLLIGRGHLGTFLKKRFAVPDHLHYTGELADIKMFSNLAVNTAGKTSLEWCEANPTETFRCNVIAPLMAFRQFKTQNHPKHSLFVHISSGCVWDGPFPPIGLGFTPNEPVTPQCFYSWTKAACDGLLLQESQGWNLAILRPRQVYSPLASPRNTLTKIRTYPKLIRTQNSMTSADTIALTIDRIAMYPDHALNGRIINVYDRGVITPYEVGCMLATAGLREKPELLEKKDLDLTLKPKRVDTVLEDKFFEDLVRPPKIEDEMPRIIQEYKKACLTP
jgi:nucleoside-diphosphate-sugar epimerase